MGFTSVSMVASMYPTFQRNLSAGQQRPSDQFIQQYIDDLAGHIKSILQRRFGEAINSYTPSGTPATALRSYLIALGIPTITWLPNLAVALGEVVVDSNTPPGVQQVTVAGITGTINPEDWNATVGGATPDDGTVTWTNIGQTPQFQVLERGNRYGAAGQLGEIFASFGVSNAAAIGRHYLDTDWALFIQELNSVDGRGQAKQFGAFDVLFDPLANVSSPRPGLLAIAGADQPWGVGPAQEGLGAYFGKSSIDGTRQSSPPGGPGGTTNPWP
jgi:hypothetical protein